MYKSTILVFIYQSKITSHELYECPASTLGYEFNLMKDVHSVHSTSMLKCLIL